MENVKHVKTEIPSLTETLGKDDSDTNIITVKGKDFTAQFCIESLKTLAGDFPDRRITRDFYRQNGGTPEAAWTGHFGNFPEFLRQAGLEHTRDANKIRNAAARHAAVDELRKISATRNELGDTYARDDKNGRFKTMVACSDLHDEECDPFYLRVLCETIKDVNPDVVCLDGDIFDVPEFGKYGVDPLPPSA